MENQQQNTSFKEKLEQILENGKMFDYLQFLYYTFFPFT